MSVYTSLVRGVLFPLHERLKQHDSPARLRELERSQWLSPAEIRATQGRKLSAFMEDVAAHVPYYRDWFRREGIDPSSIDDASKLTALPLLTKPLIREHTEAMKAEDAGPLQRFNTGGSSGEPLVFYMGKGRVSHDVAAKWRATRWWDVDIGDPEIVLWGSPVELGRQDRMRQIRDTMIRSRLVPAFEMSPANMDEFIRIIRHYRPAMLFGYPSSTALLVQHAQRSGQRLDDLGIKVAFVTSERLYPEQRKVIEEGVGCPVANGYGGRDAGFIAHQCPAGGMHLSAEDIVVEIVDPEGNPLPPGEEGEIVTTHLATRDFPFVRYRTGDVGVLSDEPCACGRGLPVFKEIMGRTTDFIVAADGTVMHGLALIYIVRDLTSVKHFKIHQQSLERTRLLLVVGDGYTDKDEAAIVSGFKQRLGASVEIALEYMDEIPRERSGKFRYVVSDVSPLA
ncbi:MAG: phenylacetate--CoA ligase family protein [Gammaproteobacteria bacterium]